MEGWRLLFEVQYHLGLPGGGRNGQNCPNFIRDKPCREQPEGKNTNQNRWQVRHVASNFCWDILVSAKYEVGRKKIGKKVPNVLRCSLSLQTPAPDRVKD